MSRFNQPWLHRLGGPVEDRLPADLADLAARLEAKLKTLDPAASENRHRALSKPAKPN